MEFERNDNTLQLCRDPVQRSQSASETSASPTCTPLLVVFYLDTCWRTKEVHSGTHSNLVSQLKI